MNQKDQIVLLTGASAGIGSATARVFAREGAKLILVARRMDRLKALAAELSEKYSTLTYLIELDISQNRLVQAKLSDLPKEWSSINLLINNAGLAMGFDKIQNGSISDWEVMIDTNVKGLLYVTRAILPGMIERKDGHIINIGSIAGHETYPSGNIYCATKHAVRSLTRAIQLDVVDTPIRVGSVDPGIVETEFSVVRFKGDKERAKKIYSNFDPLRPEDIAESILFVASRPKHVNIHEMVVFPTHQASAAVVHRKG